MKIFSKLPCLAMLSFAFSVTAYAGDPERGQQLSEPCVACHGADGVSVSPAFPHIAGQLEEYLYQALLDYKVGQRENAIMAPQAENLSRQDMKDLAAFYSQQKGQLFLKR
ncbi:MAG TPA: cytochrome c [Azoarcus sp.]|nr:cytochrome c [Azoarcus sp.]